MYGFDPRDSVWEQRRHIASIILGARLIVHLAIVRESGNRSGVFHQPEMTWRTAGKEIAAPIADDDQRQRCSDDDPEDATAHTGKSQPCGGVYR
jgi:hypothetical protein